MFPLTKRQLIRGFEAHKKAGLGGAADYVANYETYYAPFSGMLFAFQEAQGGLWLRLTRDGIGDKIEVSHLSKYLKKTGRVKEGEPIAITGNTGSLTTGPHAHVQIINKKGFRLDPEAYDWNPVMFPITLRVAVLINRMDWPSIETKVRELEAWFLTASQGRLELKVDVLETELSGWDYRVWGPGAQYDIINPDWFKAKVLPIAGDWDGIVFVIANGDWQGDGPPESELQGHCFEGWPLPISSYIITDENEHSYYYPEHSAFFDYARHELIHGLYKIGQPSKFDFTHKHFYDERKPEACFADFDYSLLASNLNSRKIKIRFVGWNDKEQGYYIPADTMERLGVINDFLKDQPKYMVDSLEWNLGKRPWQ